MLLVLCVFELRLLLLACCVSCRRGAPLSEVVMLGWSEGQQQVEGLQRLAFPHAGPSRASYASMIGLVQDCDIGIGVPNKLLPMQTLSTGEQSSSLMVGCAE